MSGAVANDFLQILCLIGFIVTLFRLHQFGLSSKYRFFSAYLALSAVQLAVSLSLDVGSGAYMKFFILAQPLTWFLYVAVVLELYRLVLEQYPGILTLGRWALYASITVSVLLSVLTLLPRFDSPGFQKRKLLSSYFVIERGVDGSLVIFLLLILLILRGFPVRLSRNVIVHCFVYSTLFFANAAALLLRSLFDQAQNRVTVNLIILGINALSAVLWATLLNARGEVTMVHLSGFSAQHEEQVLNKLNALSTTVLRASRK